MLTMRLFIGSILVYIIHGILFVECSEKWLSQPVDLGHGLDDDGVISFPGFPPFHYTRRTTGHWGGPNGPWYTTNQYATSDHSGTTLSVSAVSHPRATKIGSYPLEKLITSAILLDVSKEVKGNWKYTLPACKLDDWVEKNGEIPQNSVLFIKFGWSWRYPNVTLYSGPSNTDLRYPGLSMEAVSWIVNSGRIVGVGADTLSPNPGSTVLQDAPVFLTLLDNNIYELENVNLQADLPPRFNVIIMPMKLTTGAAAQTRIIAN